MSGVPWFFCKDSQCYRVRSGFRFPGIEQKPLPGERDLDAVNVLSAAKQLLEDGEQFLQSLREFCETLDFGSGADP